MKILGDGALFEASNYYWPDRVWSARDKKWYPYEGKAPKDVGWGDIISEFEADEFMAPVNG